jgi:hypothetical protein
VGIALDKKISCSLVSVHMNTINLDQSTALASTPAMETKSELCSGIGCMEIEHSTGLVFDFLTIKGMVPSQKLTPHESHCASYARQEAVVSRV